MSDIELDYDYLTQKALRQVIVDCLKITADLGDAPGEHHFYIEFLTGAPGVVIPDHLRTEYPERMTIVLQHQFENLQVSDEAFSVSLSFKGKPADLTIPLDAITSFFDPSVEFGLRFELVKDEAVAEESETEQAETNDAPAETGDETTDAAQDSADVVSLDSFRKK